MGYFVAHGMDTKRWRLRLLRIAWWSVFVAVLVELAVFMAMFIMDGAGPAWSYLLVAGQLALYMGAVMALVHGISKQLILRERFKVQAYVFITGISAIAAGIAWTHRTVVTVHAVFMMPIILSYVFVRRTPRWYAFVLNVCLYASFIMVFYLVEPDMVPDFAESSTLLGLLLICQLIGSLIHDRQASLMENVVEAHRNSMMDSLTRLYNHAAFYEHLDQHILKHSRGEGGFSLIIFDIDSFKRINDQYGHDVGDEVLLALVDAITEAVGDGDEAHRYGGEEFTVLTSRGTQQSSQLAEAIRAGFTRHVAERRSGLHATVSAGVSSYDPVCHGGRREFFASADEALYRAKRTGKDKVVIWSEALLERSRGGK